MQGCTIQQLEGRMRVPDIRPIVVCLCGSTKFKNEFIKANFQETMKGRIVLTVGWFSHVDKDVFYPSPEQKQMLDKLHFRKIELADEILVIDVGGYIGESTNNEIKHAELLNKPVRFWSREEDNDASE